MPVGAALRPWRQRGDGEGRRDAFFRWAPSEFEGAPEQSGGDKRILNNSPFAETKDTDRWLLDPPGEVEGRSDRRIKRHPNPHEPVKRSLPPAVRAGELQSPPRGRGAPPQAGRAATIGFSEHFAVHLAMDQHFIRVVPVERGDQNTHARLVTAQQLERRASSPPDQKRLPRDAASRPPGISCTTSSMVRPDACSSTA